MAPFTAQPVFTTEGSPVVIMDDCGDSCQCPDGMTGVQPFCAHISSGATEVPPEVKPVANESLLTPPSSPNLTCPEGFTGLEPFCVSIGNRKFLAV